MATGSTSSTTWITWGADGCRVLTSNQTRRTISEYLMRNSIYNKFPAFRRLLDQFFVTDYGDNYRASLDNALDAELSCWEAAPGRSHADGGLCAVSPLPYHGGAKWREPPLLHRLELDRSQPVPGASGVY